jgi:hypothetical protein
VQTSILQVAKHAVMDSNRLLTMANNEFTNEDLKLFHKIEADIKKNCAKYGEAGKWLDQF